MKRNWKFRSLATGALVLVGVLAPTLALAGSNNPQSPDISAAAAAPDKCYTWQQMEPAEQKYRKTSNIPKIYDIGTVGAGYFNVACGALSFTVPRGTEALVDMSATAELDCQAPTGSNGWCDGRFLVNSSAAHPDNTDRGDTYAWDATNGGTYDWSAHSLDQEYRAVCAASTTTSVPCTFRVTLQSRLVNGATSVWIDDLTVRVDVTVGKVSISTVG